MKTKILFAHLFAWQYQSLQRLVLLMILCRQKQRSKMLTLTVSAGTEDEAPATRAELVEAEVLKVHGNGKLGTS